MHRGIRATLVKSPKSCMKLQRRMYKSMKIALQLYSIRDTIEKDFEYALRQVAETGYAGVEFAGLYGNGPLKVKSLLKEYGLKAVSAHVPLAELTANPVKCIEDYKKIGCKYIAIPWLAENDRPGKAGYDKVKKSISEIAAECAKQGVILLYHNHDFEFIKINGEYALDLLYKEIPALQTEIDTCWVNVAGENPAAYIKKYTGRAPIVHLKDFLMKGQKPSRLYELIGVDKIEQKEAGSFEFRPLGYGQQNVPALLAAASESGAEWIVVEQDEPGMGKSSLECARMSLEYLKSLNNTGAKKL